MGRLRRLLAGASAVAVCLAAITWAGTCTVTPSASWKNSIAFPNDPFHNNGGGIDEAGFVKFTILVDCDLNTVYYQNSVSYPFHYEFATERFDPFLGLTLEQFEAVTLHNDGREGLLGAVVTPPQEFGQPPIQEYGIQLISLDPLDPQLVVDAFLAVEASVSAGAGVQAFYFPTFEQLASAEQNAAFFASNGIQISSTARWTDGNRCYSKGWGLGRVKFFPANAITPAFLAGDLESGDILLTDGVPSDMPLVAGVMALAPATPNSHVVILANTFQVPFVFLAEPGDVQRAQELVGRQVVVRAFDEFVGFDSGDSCDFRLIDVEDELTRQQIDEILLLKVPAPLSLQPVSPAGMYARNTDVLTPAAIDNYGGKASNFGFLRRSIPLSSPVALGLSFDLWTEFLDQTLAGGGTLRQHIDSVLAPYTFPPPDMQAFVNDLVSIQELIEDTDETVFTTAQQAAILAALQNPQYGFDPFKKLRFRSSTNVEDSEQFTGAGLYDSKSGCLADELDGDDSGPGQCDPTENNEKGVFRAIRKVFASFYYQNAVLERLRHQIDESQVGMAMLVHHSFPDEIELANGVATFERTPTTNDLVRLVSQPGANSVANPDPGQVPEVVDVVFFGQTPSANLIEPSNLVLLGDTVMEWSQDYIDLANLLRTATDQFQAETGKSNFVLDFEYKLLEPGGGALPAGGLVVKQIREIPQPDTTPSITPFLVNEPAELVTLGNPPGRVKARWDLETRNTWLDAVSLNAGSVYTDIRMDFTDGCRILGLDGSVPALPGAAHSYNSSAMRSLDSWDLAELPNPRTYTLRTEALGSLVSAAESPILTLRDLARNGLAVAVQHDQAVPQFPGSATLVTSDNVVMGVALDPALEVPVQRVLTADGLTIDTSYRIHPPPDICAGCAPLLSRFVSTTITGLTTTPIVLDDRFSGGYVAGNHAFFETFTFEPLLEPGLTFETLTELAAQDVRVIRVNISNIGVESEVTIDLFDDAAVGGTCPSPQPAGALDPTLVVARSIGGELTLGWDGSCLGSDDDYAVYEGSIGAFGSHLPRLCSTGGSEQTELTPAATDAYYLVVPRNAYFEGSSGLDGAGVPRPQAAGACYARELASCP